MRLGFEEMVLGKLHGRRFTEF